MNALSFDNLLELDLEKAWIFLGDVIRNPTSNLQAFVLLLAAITIVVLLIIVVLLLVFSGDSEEEEEDEFEDDDFEYERVRPVAVPLLDEPRELTPEERRRRHARRLTSAVIWAAVWALVWVAGGWVTARDEVCSSCHLDDSIHAVRMGTNDVDPHAGVACVSCHETASPIAAATLAVPARAAHFVGGFLRNPMAAGYGTPVAVRACRSCHESDIKEATENPDRGVRMSHAEPLAAKAQCVDCHAPHADTGIIDRYTVGMVPCLRCHDARQASAECSYCHTKDIAFAMQSRGVAKPVSHAGEIDCGGCHSQESCDACHGTRMPHSVAFMGGGHAREAVEDIWFNNGRACARCHTETRRPCSKCHEGTFPAHGSTFRIGHQAASRTNNGCDNCHGRLASISGRNFCANCHPN